MTSNKGQSRQPFHFGREYLTVNTLFPFLPLQKRPFRSQIKVTNLNNSDIVLHQVMWPSGEDTSRFAVVAVLLVCLFFNAACGIVY